MAKGKLVTVTQACRMLHSRSKLASSALRVVTSLSCGCHLNHKRSASFWTPSFPSDSNTSLQVPYLPSIPAVPGTSVLPSVPSPHLVAQAPDQAKKRERKQRYLDNLMDKAGELSLRCEYIHLNSAYFSLPVIRLDLGC